MHLSAETLRRSRSKAKWAWDGWIERCCCSAPSVLIRLSISNFEVAGNYWSVESAEGTEWPCPLSAAAVFQAKRSGVSFNTNSERSLMFLILCGVLIAAWLLGWGVFYVAGGLIHLA